MTSSSVVYPLIHVLMTMRTAIVCTIHKILYDSDPEDSKHSSSKMVVMVLTPKNSFSIHIFINKVSVSDNKFFSWQILLTGCKGIT